MLDTHLLHHFLLWILNRIDVASLFGYETCLEGLLRQRKLRGINLEISRGSIGLRMPGNSRNEEKNNGVKGKEGDLWQKPPLSLYFHFTSDSHADLHWWEESDIPHTCNDCKLTQAFLPS